MSELLNLEKDGMIYYLKNQEYNGYCIIGVAKQVTPNKIFSIDSSSFESIENAEIRNLEEYVRNKFDKILEFQLKAYTSVHYKRYEAYKPIIGTAIFDRAIETVLDKPNLRFLQYSINLENITNGKVKIYSSTCKFTALYDLKTEEISSDTTLFEKLDKYHLDDYVMIEQVKQGNAPVALLEAKRIKDALDMEPVSIFIHYQDEKKDRIRRSLFDSPLDLIRIIRHAQICFRLEHL